jgi:Uma2 family endonuclease
MIAAREDFPRLTPEEYFAWEEQQQIRHEYINGELYAMTGGTLNHSEIASNFGFILKAHLRANSSCRILNSDARVNIHNSSNYVYPDVSVSCDARDKSATNFLNHPCLIVEVLSPKTEAYDRGDKFFLYRQSPSLQDYVLVSTNKIAVDIYHLNDRGRWEILSYTAGDLVELACINLSFPIEDIFENIVFREEEREV